ncbi:hypothetical protein TUM4261_32980 [Shewanella sp. c952]|uniref:hypothetical protein n=1 Tax=Shewanella sp. c952 TaxID=2815913 RepID=UPI001BC4F961|nr:hypothetical protein [Shewanella sp. c952]GIU15649.1 hypothetical protein TUM4261_32980 [Shewanella sp. c952]
MQYDLSIEPVMNIKRLRSELKAWGRYWASQEKGLGYASRNACDRLGEPITTGYFNARESITPNHIILYDVKINGLAVKCRQAIRAQYVCRGKWELMGFESKKNFLFWLNRGEINLF